MKKLNFKNLMGGKILLLAPLVIMILGFLIILFSYLTEKDVKIVSMKVTNVSENSATVTWLSKTKDKGILVVSEANDFGILSSFSKAHFYDERDQSSETLKERYTHQVKVTGLNPETKYYFRVTEGLKLTEYTYPALETAPTLNTLATPDPSYGSLNTGTLGDDVLIYSRFKGSTLGSSVVESNGSFSLDKTNYRTQTLEARETYNDGDIIVFEVLTNEGVANYVVKIGEDKPFRLGELKDSLIKQTSLNKSLVSGVNAKEANEDGGGTDTPPPSSVPAPTPGALETPTLTPEPAPACVPSCSNVQCGNMNSCGTGYCTSDCKAPEKPATIDSLKAAANPYEGTSCDVLKDQCKEADTEACAEYGRRSCRPSESKLTATNTDAKAESMKASGIASTLEDCKGTRNKYEREECKAVLDREANITESIINIVKARKADQNCLTTSWQAAYDLVNRFPDENKNFANAAYNTCCSLYSCEDVRPATAKELCGSVGLEPRVDTLHDNPLSAIQSIGRSDLCNVTSLEACKKIDSRFTAFLNGNCYTDSDKKESPVYLWETIGKKDPTKFCDEWYGLGDGKFQFVRYQEGVDAYPVCAPKQSSTEVCDLNFSWKPNWGTMEPGKSAVVSPSSSNGSSIYLGVTKNGKCIKNNDSNGKLLLTKYKGEITKEYCNEINIPRGQDFYEPNPDKADVLVNGRECVKVVEKCPYGTYYVSANNQCYPLDPNLKGSYVPGCPAGTYLKSAKGECYTYSNLMDNLTSDEDCQDRFNTKNVAFNKETKECVPTSPEMCNNSIFGGTYFDLSNYVAVEDGKCVDSQVIAERNMNKNKKATQTDCDQKYFHYGYKSGDFVPRDPLNPSSEYCVPATIEGCKVLHGFEENIVGVTPSGECLIAVKKQTELPIILAENVVKDQNTFEFVKCSNRTVDGSEVCKQKGSYAYSSIKCTSIGAPIGGKESYISEGLCTGYYDPEIYKKNVAKTSSSSSSSSTTLDGALPECGEGLACLPSSSNVANSSQCRVLIGVDVRMNCCKAGESIVTGVDGVSTCKSNTTTTIREEFISPDVPLCSTVGVSCVSKESQLTNGTKCRASDSATSYSYCCPNGQLIYENTDGTSSCKTLNTKVNLDNSYIQKANAATGVLGVSDGNDTVVKVDEKGIYKVSVDNTKVALLSNKFAFTEGELTGKFFIDTNLNGVKDANEEYYKDELSLKIEKVKDIESFDLTSGWNLIGWNFAKSDVLTAKDFLVRIARSGGYATHMATYRNGEWKELSIRGDSEFGTNFNLLPTEGYFVKVITPAKVVVEGTKIEKTDQVSVINGWNLMSFRPLKATMATSMIDSVNSSQKYTVDTVTKFESGRYENLVKDSTTTYGKDFNLEENKGYFVRALKEALVKKN